MSRRVSMIGRDERRRSTPIHPTRSLGAHRPVLLRPFEMAPRPIADQGPALRRSVSPREKAKAARGMSEHGLGGAKAGVKVSGLSVCEDLEYI
jgi:hypothetical protein